MSFQDLNGLPEEYSAIRYHRRHHIGEGNFEQNGKLSFSESERTELRLYPKQFRSRQAIVKY